VWREKDSLPDETSLADYLLHAPATTTVLHEVTTDEATSVDESSVPETGARRTVNARFSRPYLAHASLAPSCGVALFEAGVLKVWSHSQGVYPLRRELSRQCALELEDVIVEHVPGAGCYGHNAADDAAYDAALLAQAVPGRPIQVVWSRPDELGWSPLAPAMVVDITATVDDAGAIQHWQHEIWSNGHTSRPGGPGFPPLLAATHQDPPAPGVVAADPPLARGGGSGRNALPAYDLPSVRVVSHLLAEMPLRTSAMRALGAHLNVYAIEQVIDDLALAVGADPLDYRLRLIRDPRAAEVVRLVAERSSWGTPPEGEAAGRGLGFARYKNAGAYCAVVADVDAESEVKVTRLTIAVDVGTAVNPAGVVNQIEGGALQAISWTVKEQVRFDRGRVTSTTWEDYPILTFSEVPPVDVVLVAPPGAAPLGAGEASVGPTAAAIGNAVHAALGVRVTRLPLVPANVVVAMR
jgi:CO/xanthine dehydrogenase Mo-binding subunit